MHILSKSHRAAQNCPISESESEYIFCDRATTWLTLSFPWGSARPSNVFGAQMLGTFTGYTQCSLMLSWSWFTPDYSVIIGTVFTIKQYSIVEATQNIAKNYHFDKIALSQKKNHFAKKM